MVQDSGTTDIRDLARQVLAATDVEAVLGPDDAGRKARERDLFKRLHPDAGGDADAFAHLQSLMLDADRRAKGVFSITTKSRTYNIDGLAHRGRVANLYRATSPTPPPTHSGNMLVKIARSPKDSDLIQADASALRRIADSGKKRAGLFPVFVESFKHRDAKTRVDRRSLVMEHLEGFYSLAEVKAAYPNGVDPRDLAWMWRRALSVITLPHELGIVHGSLVPEHLLIHPQEHALVIVDFTASVEVGGTIRLLGGDRQFFPPEVFAKEPADEATDLYTLSKTMLWMLGDNAPRQFRAFVNGCTTARQKTRPHDAWALRDEFTAMIDRLWKRSYRAFHMPTERKSN